MTNLPNVTLICCDCINQGQAIVAIRETLKHINPAKTIFLTDIDFETDEFEVIKIARITSVEEYSYLMIKMLSDFFDTDFVLTIQADGWVLDGSKWDEKFLDCDYIGSTWPYPTKNVGNGAFSIRSKKLQHILATDSFIKIVSPEDEIIGRLYRDYLESIYNIVFAKEEVANKFAYELNEPTQHTFGFHKNFYNPFIEHIVIKRSGASGDIIMCEPLVYYFSEKGFQVVMDIPLDEMRLFIQYPFHVKHISQMNTKIIPDKVINLDMSYENKPLQPVLKSYYERAGIKDGITRNSMLYIHQEESQKLLEKYILIHNDETSMNYRNSYGVNWGFIVNYYQKIGYTVLQVGNNPREKVATRFNCPTKDVLMYMCKGADLVIGLDSGVCQLSVALGTPTVILSGSVNLKLRYSDFDKIGVVQGICPKEEFKNCYHSKVGTVGIDCIFDKDIPPCCLHSEFSIIEQSNKLLKLN